MWQIIQNYGAEQQIRRVQKVSCRLCQRHCSRSLWICKSYSAPTVHRAKTNLNFRECPGVEPNTCLCLDAIRGCVHGHTPGTRTLYTEYSVDNGGIQSDLLEVSSSSISKRSHRSGIPKHAAITEREPARAPPWVREQRILLATKHEGGEAESVQLILRV